MELSFNLAQIQDFGKVYRTKNDCFFKCRRHDIMVTPVAHCGNKTERRSRDILKCHGYAVLPHPTSNWTTIMARLRRFRWVRGKCIFRRVRFRIFVRIQGIQHEMFAFYGAPLDFERICKLH